MSKNNNDFSTQLQNGYIHHSCLIQKWPGSHIYLAYVSIGCVCYRHISFFLRFRLFPLLDQRLGLQLRQLLPICQMVKLLLLQLSNFIGVFFPLLRIIYYANVFQVSGLVIVSLTPSVWVPREMLRLPWFVVLIRDNTVSVEQFFFLLFAKFCIVHSRNNFATFHNVAFIDRCFCLHKKSQNCKVWWSNIWRETHTSPKSSYKTKKIIRVLKTRYENWESFNRWLCCFLVIVDASDACHKATFNFDGTSSTRQFDIKGKHCNCNLRNSS